MALDSEAQRYLELYASEVAEWWQAVTVEEGRKLFASRQQLFGPGCELPFVDTYEIANGVGARVYRPCSERPLPAIVFFHGGGWVVGDLDTHDSMCRKLAQQTGTVVVAVDYRRAPEAAFPAPLDDCFAGVCWVGERSIELGIDASRIAVAGDSAGGNLAAAVCLLARDRGGPPLRFQLLFYPPLDPTFSSRSYQLYAEGCGLTRDAMRWFWSQYLNTDSFESVSAYAAPLRASDFRRLPPALIVTAECDVLSDDGAAFAMRLRESGVTVTHLHCGGLVHGFVHMAGIFSTSSETLKTAARTVRQALA